MPLVLGCRYVRGSRALLAFNRFDMGLMISIDGIDSRRSRAFFEAAADRMERERIGFTQHWGKTNSYTPDRLRRAYGENVQRWIEERSRLMPDPDDRWIFDNDYIRERGLAA